MHNSATQASSQWRNVQAEANRNDVADQVAGLGRWWLERNGGGIVLSAVAAGFFGVDRHANVDACLAGVEPEDRALLRNTLDRIVASAAMVECEFRVRRAGQGVRWLRLQPVSVLDGGIVTGILVDITAARNAAAREKFNAELTRYLVGADDVDDAVTRILQLVCEELGWEWGAFWALEQEAAPDAPADAQPGRLRCRYVWHAPRSALAPFKRASAGLRVRPGQGVVGKVWASGEACWIDDARTQDGLLRAGAARDSGLQSAYFFPVVFVAPDGSLLRPGVLEFFSDLQRERDSQLPGLAKSISAMIARIVERMAQQERLRIRVQTDEMTGLDSRSHFHDEFDQLLLDATPAQPFGVLYVDLDQFKPINDAYGHDAGNMVLVEFAQRLRGLAPPGWRIGRLGGDEFALLSLPGTRPAQLDHVAAAVLHAARKPFVYRQHRLTVSASVGIGMFPEHGTSTRDLLHAADAAMYTSKRNGRNLASRFMGDSGSQQEEAARELALLSDLHYAIGRNEFFLEYQPICATAAMDVVAAEALIRWRRPDGEVVPPQVFIPLAERSRLIADIGRWVVQQVCLDLPRLRQAGMGALQVHVNMAAPEFIDSELPDELAAIVARAGVDPHQVCLELTEGVIMQHTNESIPIMFELQRRGFEIGLDDFGMGYSSLSMLKRLPVGSLKIDRLFMAGVPHDEDDCAIVRSILELARHMKLRVIAEGVETDAQLAFLRQFECPLVQGFLPGRPMPLAQLAALART